MPIYEYRCESCGHTLDALQKVNDPHLTDCPECDETALKRLMSAPSFRLKGSGWYETDFKSDKERKRNLVDGKSDSGGDGKSDSGGDAKSDSGGDAKSAAGSEAKSDTASGKGSKPAAAKKETKTGSSGGSGTGTEAA